MKKDYDMKTNEFICKRPWQLLKATEDKLDQVCNIMQVCWDIHPENRPKFYNLQVDFQLTGNLIGYNKGPLQTENQFATCKLGELFQKEFKIIHFPP